MPPLKNARQERFVQELVQGKPAREACRLAGYSTCKGHSTKLMRQPAVARRYEELAGAAAQRAEVAAKDVINGLAAIAFANIADYITVDAEGLPQTDLTRMTRAQAAALVEVSASTHGVRVKLADKLAALETLGRMLGLFRDRVEVSGADGGPVETREISDFEAARRIAFVLARAAASGGDQVTPPPPTPPHT